MSSFAWIEPDEVAEALARAGATGSVIAPTRSATAARAIASSRPPASFAPLTQAEAPSTERPTTSPRSSATSAPTALPMEVPSAAPTPGAQLRPPPRFEHATAVSARVGTFADWLRAVTGAAAFYVSDPEGLAVHLEGLDDTQAVAAVALDRALRPVRGLFRSRALGSAAVELEDGRVVHTVWANTARGRFAVGFTSERALEPELARYIREGLVRVFDLAGRRAPDEGASQ